MLYIHEGRHATRDFSGQRRSLGVERPPSINATSRAYKRTATQLKISVFFLQDNLKTALLNENLNHRHARGGHFFVISGHF